MDEQQHMIALESLCRVCGGPINQPRPCKDHSEALYAAFNVDPAADRPQIHPRCFCKRCYSVLQRYNKAEEDGKVFLHSVEPVEWCAHSAGFCSVCEVIETKRKGGRPPKARKGRGRPTTSTSSDLRNALAEAIKCAPPSYFPKNQKRAFLSTIPPRLGLNTSDVECSICWELLDRPVQTQCGSVICLMCVKR